MKTNRSKYLGTQAVLYLVVQIVCGLCQSQLKAFSKFKKKYTQAYLNLILANLQTAEGLPDYDSRQGKQGSKRTSLTNINNEICSRFQDLMLYMEEGFDPSVWDDMRQEAGGGYYESAKGENWADSKMMQQNAIAFMAAYAGELANGDMPADFAANFALMNTAFLAALLAFSNGKNTTEQETTSKVDANNALYVRLQALMKDGRRIFEKDATLQKQFSYRAQMKKLRGAGSTGFRIDLKEAETLAPIADASVRFMPTGDVFDTVADGIILATVPELKAGAYSYVLTAPGYAEVTGTLTAHTGVMHRVYLVLQKVVMTVEPGEKVVS